MTHKHSTPKKEKVKVSVQRKGHGFVFAGTPDQQRAVIEFMVRESVKLETPLLYIAAQTALELNMVVEAGFFFFAGQLRAAFDRQRFAFHPKDPRKIVHDTYRLSQLTSRLVSPKVTADFEIFKSVMNKLHRWPIAPLDDSFYPGEKYGPTKIPKDRWGEVIKAVSHKFTAYAIHHLRILHNPHGKAAYSFTLAYNSGMIPQTAENKHKFEQAQKYLKDHFHQHKTKNAA